MAFEIEWRTSVWSALSTGSATRQHNKSSGNVPRRFDGFRRSKPTTTVGNGGDHENVRQLGRSARR